MAVKLASTFTEKLVLIYKVEKRKYQRKGLTCTLVGFFLLFLIIFASREIGVRMWPDHVQDKELFLATGALIIHYAAVIWSFLLMLPGYMNILPYYEKYKINKATKWPWHRDNWGIMKRKLFYNLVINKFLVFPFFVFLSTIIGVKQRFHDFPTFGEILSQLFVVYLIDDIFFYWGHRIFHEVKSLYKMHKIHHEYDKIFTVATEYFHPFDFAIANVLPSALALMILGNRAHCFTYLFWVGYKVSLSSEGHSGYEFPWSPVRILPFVLGPCYHDHHHSHNIGNYSGSCYLWDLIIGTGDHFFERFLKQDNRIVPVLT